MGGSVDFQPLAPYSANGLKLESLEGVDLNGHNQRHDEEDANNTVFPRRINDASSDSDEAVSHRSSDSDDSRYQISLYFQKNI
jgi:hypothetical protein